MRDRDIERLLDILELIVVLPYWYRIIEEVNLVDCEDPDLHPWDCLLKTPTGFDLWLMSEFAKGGDE